MIQNTRCIKMKFIKRLFFTLIFLGLIIGGWITWQGYTLYQQALEKTSLEQMEQTIRSSEHYTQLSQLPEIYINAKITQTGIANSIIVLSKIDGIHIEF